MVLGMSTDDADRDLVLVLSYLAKRQLKTAEVMGALGMSRSTYTSGAARGSAPSPSRPSFVAHLFAALPAKALRRIIFGIAVGALERFVAHRLTGSHAQQVGLCR